MSPYTYAMLFVAFWVFAGLVAKLDERAERKWAEADVR